jgi:hypothetical protein
MLPRSSPPHSTTNPFRFCIYAQAVPVTHLLSALPYISSATPLSTAFTRSDRGARVARRFFFSRHSFTPSVKGPHVVQLRPLLPASSLQSQGSSIFNNLPSLPRALGAKGFASRLRHKFRFSSPRVFNNLRTLCIVKSDLSPIPSSYSALFAKNRGGYTPTSVAFPSF